MIDAKMVFWDFIVSLWRVVAGVTLAVVLALILTWIRGSLGRKWRENALIRFFFEAPKFPPPIAWIPLVVLLAGIGELAAILIVMIGALAPLFTGLYDGFIHFKEQYLWLADSYGLSRWERWHLLYQRGLRPQFFTALKTATGMGWMAVIAAEMISGQSGLGYGIGLARIYLRYDFILLYMFLMACGGQLLFLLIDWLRSRLIPWESSA